MMKCLPWSHGNAPSAQTCCGHQTPCTWPSLAGGRLLKEVSANCREPSTVHYLPPGWGMANPRVTSAGWGGRLSIGHSKWAQGLGSVCPLARRSARFNMHRVCTNAFRVGARQGSYPPTQLSSDSPAESYRAPPKEVHDYPPFPLVHAASFALVRDLLCTRSHC